MLVNVPRDVGIAHVDLPASIGAVAGLDVPVVGVRVASALAPSDGAHADDLGDAGRNLDGVAEARGAGG